VLRDPGGPEPTEKLQNSTQLDWKEASHVKMTELSEFTYRPPPRRISRTASLSGSLKQHWKVLSVQEESTSKNHNEIQAYLNIFFIRNSQSATTGIS